MRKVKNEKIKPQAVGHFIFAMVLRPIICLGLLAAALGGGLSAMAGANRCQAYVRKSQIVEPKPWSPELILDVVRFLDSKGVDVTAAAMRKNISLEATELIYQVSGRRVKASSFLRKSREYIKGGWLAVLKKAEVRIGKEDRRKNQKGFWNQDTLIKVLQWLDSKGINLEQVPLQSNDLKDLAHEMSGQFGRVFSGSALVGAAKGKPPYGFSSLGKARIAAGINGYAIQVSWNKDMVLLAIRVLHENGVSLQSAQIQKNKSTHIKKKLLEELGIPAAPVAVYGAATRKFKATDSFSSWEVALSKAGIDPLKVRRRNHRPWSKEKVLAAIKALHKKGHSLKAGQLAAMNRYYSIFFFYSQVGHGSPVTSLLASSYRYFSTWLKAVEAAGIDPRPFKRSDRYWNRELIVRVIRTLAAHEHSLNQNSVFSDSSLSFQNILYEVTGHRVVGKTFISAVNTHFYEDRVVSASGRLLVSSWDAALKLAGFDPAEHRLRNHVHLNIF